MIILLTGASFEDLMLTTLYSYFLIKDIFELFISIYFGRCHFQNKLPNFYFKK